MAKTVRRSGQRAHPELWPGAVLGRGSAVHGRHRRYPGIEYNLEHLEDLSVDELDLLKRTADNLILHMERLKKREASSG